MKETKCEICSKEFDYGTEYYDDLCDECAEGESRTFEDY
jgi:hypothetical protein